MKRKSVSLTIQDKNFTVSGLWVLSNYKMLEEQVNQVIDQRQSFNFFKIDDKITVDSYGLYLLSRLIHYSHTVKVKADIPDKIVEQLSNYNFDKRQVNPVKREYNNLIITMGRTVVDMPKAIKNALMFFGQFISQWGACIRGQEKFRYKTLCNILEEAGINALGIIGLVAFLLGIVLVYQSVNQLARFGAQIYTINLLAISVLRELGVLITAILVAGRSGSAFTAELGFMKLNNEIDALNVMGINPFNLLILPRIIGLMIALPLLVIFADLVALIGGGFLSTLLIDVSWGQYWQQLKMAVTPWTVWSGLIKAPFFGLIIGSISCYEGFAVSGGSEDVGRRTTKSVVRSIFIVIILDAIFSVIYAKLGL